MLDWIKQAAARKMSKEKTTIDEYLEINEKVINLLIFTIGTVHMFAFVLLIYALVCKLLFVPFSYKWGILHTYGVEISDLTFGEFSLLLFLSGISYLLVLGFISLMIGIYQKLKQLNENILQFGFDANATLRAALLVKDECRRVSRSRRKD